MECRRAILLALALSCCFSVIAAWDGKWKTGRATRYGGLDDFWSIHDGSCWHKYLSPYVKTGWDVAAMPDTFSDYHGGSCGRCYEVRCRNSKIRDGYGQWLDRGSVCYDQGASVVVQITDTCPCHYPANAYSNKRWCCGDIDHLDLSTWAFEKLASKQWGVIGIEFREVSCKHTPDRKAQLPNGQKPAPGHGAPKGFDNWRDDPRPWP